MQGGFLFLPFSPTFGVGWGDGRDSSVLGGEKDLGVQKGSLIGLPILLPKYGKLLALMLRSESLIASGPTIQSPVPLARNRGVYSMNGSRMGEKRRNAFGHSPIGRKPRRFSHFPPRLWMVAWVHHCRRGEREVKHEEGRETGRTRRDIQQFDNIGSFRETISVLNRNLDLSPAPIYLELSFLLANPAFPQPSVCRLVRSLALETVRFSSFGGLSISTSPRSPYLNKQQQEQAVTFRKWSGHGRGEGVKK